MTSNNLIGSKYIIQESIWKIYFYISSCDNKDITDHIFEIIKVNLNDYLNPSKWNLYISILKILNNLSVSSKAICKDLAENGEIVDNIIIKYLQIKEEDNSYLLIKLISYLLIQIPELAIKFSQLKLFSLFRDLIMKKVNTQTKEWISVYILSMIQNIPKSSLPFIEMKEYVEIIAFELLEDNKIILHNTIISIITLLQTYDQDFHKAVNSYLYEEILDTLNMRIESSDSDIEKIAQDASTMLTNRAKIYKI